MDRIHHHSDLSRSPRPGADAGATLQRDASRNLLRLEEGTLYVVLGTGQWATPSGSLHVAHVVQGTGSQAWQVCATDRLAAALASQLGLVEGQTVEVGPKTLAQLHVAIESYEAFQDAERSFQDLLQARRTQHS